MIKKINDMSSKQTFKWKRLFEIRFKKIFEKLVIEKLEADAIIITGVIKLC